MLLDASKSFTNDKDIYKFSTKYSTNNLIFRYDKPLDTFTRKKE